MTGGAGDIGWAVCRAASRLGVQVVCADIPSALERRRADLDADGLIGVPLDISRQEDVAAVVDRVETEVGPIDRLVHSAAVAQVKPVLEITADEWRRNIDINLNGAFWCLQEVTRRMAGRGHGRVVNLASVAGKVGGLQVGAHYAAGKAGVISLTFSFAKALAASGVLVNAVAPGVIRTRMTDDFSPDVHEAYRASVPLGRYGTADEVARAIVWLLSDENTYITGEVLDVNGGLLVD
ncbi:SDR family NAD(P)-dependent oxidoreductase [Blastococcus sp. SYSU DS0973]